MILVLLCVCVSRVRFGLSVCSLVSVLFVFRGCGMVSIVILVCFGWVLVSIWFEVVLLWMLGSLVVCVLVMCFLLLLMIIIGML